MKKHLPLLLIVFVIIALFVVVADPCINIEGPCCRDVECTDLNLNSDDLHGPWEYSPVFILIGFTVLIAVVVYGVSVRGEEE